MSNCLFRRPAFADRLGTHADPAHRSAPPRQRRRRADCRTTTSSPTAPASASSPSHRARPRVKNARHGIKPLYGVQIPRPLRAEYAPAGPGREHHRGPPEVPSGLRVAPPREPQRGQRTAPSCATGPPRKRSSPACAPCPAWRRRNPFALKMARRDARKGEAMTPELTVLALAALLHGAQLIALRRASQPRARHRQDPQHRAIRTGLQNRCWSRSPTPRTGRLAPRHIMATTTRRCSSSSSP